MNTYRLYQKGVTNFTHETTAETKAEAAATFRANDLPVSTGAVIRV